MRDAHYVGKKPKSHNRRSVVIHGLILWIRTTAQCLGQTKLPDTVSTEGEITRLAWFEKANHVKVILLKTNIGLTQIPTDFESQQVVIEDSWVSELADADLAVLNAFKKQVMQAQNNLPISDQILLKNASFFKDKDCRTREALLCLNQFQQSLLLN